MPKAIFGHSSHGNTEISFALMHCVVCKFEKLRNSYIEKCLRPFLVHGCHGNAKMHMPACYLLALYSLQVRQVNREGCPRSFFIDGCHGYTKMLMPAKFTSMHFMVRKFEK